MWLPEEENQLLEVVQHAHLNRMEEVGLQEVAHDTGNMSKDVESLVNKALPEFSISCLGVDIVRCSI